MSLGSGRAVTRADVARYAGVSTAVVSYVVNGGPKPVAPATAARVREAIEVLRYRPNVNAQALRRGTTQMFGLILSDTANPFFAEFAGAIEAAAATTGHALMTGNSRGEAAQERRLVEDLARRQVDGLIVASVWSRPDLVDNVPRGGPPVVWIDASTPVPGYSTVGCDGARGMALAVRHLIETHGHRSVGMVVGEAGPSDFDPREHGWRDTLREAGLEEAPIARASWTRQGGYEAGGLLLDRTQRPTAIVAASDLQAVGLLRAAHERGLRVPDDLAVVSFDGTVEAEYTWPPLTTVRQPIRPMAEATVSLLLDADATPAHPRFLPDLLIRASCGCSAPAPTPAGAS